MHNKSPSRLHLITLSAVLLLVALVYWPGLHGPFVFDDYNNILNNDAVLIKELSITSLYDAMMSGEAGPAKRPLTMLTFGLNHVWSGLDPFYFKITNLIIHLGNGLLVYLFARRLIELRLRIAQRQLRDFHWLALAAAGVWLAHPVQLTSVLYVVQRMASLSASFLLLGLCFYLRARTKMLDGAHPWPTLWLVVPGCTLAAALAKENGVLLIPIAFAVEVSLLRFAYANKPRLGSLEQFYFVFLFVPSMVMVVFLLKNPDWLTVAELWRPFTMVERVMTESRVLLLYLKILLIPSAHDLALFYDDFTISRGLFDPPATFASIIAIAAVTGFALVRRQRYPWLAFAVLWFLVAHAMESSFLMLELVHAHRNYVAYLGPILAACIGLTRVTRLIGLRLPMLVATSIFLLTLIVTWQRAVQWSNPIDQIAFELHHRPNSARANYELGRLYFLTDSYLKTSTHRESARKHFWRSAELDPQSLNGLLALALIDSEPGKAISSRVMTTLISRIRSRPLKPPDFSAYSTFVACQARRNCHSPPEQLLEIFGAILSNSSIDPVTKAKVLVVTAPYYSNVLGDLSGCLRLIEEATILQPRDATIHLVLARGFIAAKEYDRADDQIRIARSLNSFGESNRDIRAVGRLLAAQEGGVSHN